MNPTETRSHPAHRVSSQPLTAVPARLTWLLELMGRFARERQDDHDSARLAAAIVIHLRALDAETPAESSLSPTIDHWLELWEAVLERALSRHAPQSGASLFDLVQRARLTAV